MAGRMLDKSRVDGGGTIPVVLIGAGRSGTKFLRSVIAASAAAKAVPYDVNYVWRHGNESYPHDALPSEALKPKTASYIKRTLERLAGIHRGDGTRFLVEKTVSNSLRVQFVDKALRDARFIYIVRDGRDVVESAWRVWNEPPDLKYLVSKAMSLPMGNFGYALWYLKNMAAGMLTGRRGVKVWGPRYPGIEDDLKNASLLEVCAVQWRECVRHAREALSRVDETRCFELSYEALVSDEEIVRKLCRFLEIPDCGRVMDFYRSTVIRNTGGRWERSFSNEEKKKVMDIIRQNLHDLGYIPSI